jgi:hypothetical protein
MTSQYTAKPGDYVLALGTETTVHFNAIVLGEEAFVPSEVGRRFHDVGSFLRVLDVSRLPDLATQGRSDLSPAILELCKPERIATYCSHANAGPLNIANVLEENGYVQTSDGSFAKRKSPLQPPSTAPLVL